MYNLLVHLGPFHFDRRVVSRFNYSFVIHLLYTIIFSNAIDKLRLAKSSNGRSFFEAHQTPHRYSIIFSCCDQPPSSLTLFFVGHVILIAI